MTKINKIKTGVLAQAFYESISNLKTPEEINSIVTRFKKLFLKDLSKRKIKEFLSLFKKIFEKENKIIHAEILISEKIDSVSEKKIETWLTKKHRDLNITTEQKIDKNLGSGIEIKIGDEKIKFTFGSITGQLKTFLNN